MSWNTFIIRTPVVGVWRFGCGHIVELRDELAALGLDLDLAETLAEVAWNGGRAIVKDAGVFVERGSR
jgi:hypothetical protein